MLRDNSNSTRPIWFRGGRGHRLCHFLSLVLRSRNRQIYNYDVTRVLVFLVSRDLYSHLASIINKCTSAGVLVKNIFILDMGTSSGRCKAIYENYQLQGINLISVSQNSEAFGPYIAWLDESIAAIIRENNYPYIVTDTDLRFPHPYPEDWLEQMFFLLNKYRIFTKISLPLRVSDIDVDDRKNIVRHEEMLGSGLVYRLLQVLFNVRSFYRVCQTDTTFSLYRPGLEFSTISLRLEIGYEILHMPWYKSFVNTHEYEFYKRHKRPEFGMWS